MACTLSDGDVQEVESNCKTQKPDLQQAFFLFLYQTKHKPRIQDKSKNHRSSQQMTTQQNITDALTIQFIQGRLIREQVTGGE